VFRLNIGVGRDEFQALFGAQDGDLDYTVFDRLLPHPVYATQSWVCVVNPGEATDAEVRRLLRDAHARASRRAVSAS
jgi:hypothetical protein